jgi:hypothetical protein
MLSKQRIKKGRRKEENKLSKNEGRRKETSEGRKIYIKGKIKSNTLKERETTDTPLST